MQYSTCNTSLPYIQHTHGEVNEESYFVTEEARSTHQIMKRPNVMHCGLSFSSEVTSSSASGRIGASLSTTESRFTWQDMRTCIIMITYHMLGSTIFTFNRKDQDSDIKLTVCCMYNCISLFLPYLPLRTLCFIKIFYYDKDCCKTIDGNISAPSLSSHDERKCARLFVCG